MSRNNNWIPLDKNMAQYLPHIEGEYSAIEAMYSYTLDKDNGKEGTISGYSKLWGWSRNKVRRFIKNVSNATGHQRDSKRTHAGHPIHFIDLALRSKKDIKRTGEGQEKDTTIETKTKEKKNIKKEFPSDFKLNNAMIKYCMEKSNTKNPELMFEDFKNNHISKGNKFANWNSAWQTWCRNDVKFNKVDNSNLTLLQRAF